MVVALVYVAAARKCGLVRMLASHYDLSWTAVRYCGYVRTLLRYYNHRVIASPSRHHHIVLHHSPASVPLHLYNYDI